MQPTDAMQWSLAIFLALLEATILALIWTGTRRPSPSSKCNCIGINLEKVISEQDGAASFSRFQFMIFTFIIASAYIVLAFHDVALGKGLPAIDNSVLGLIGISGGSYLVSKGIETSGNAGTTTTSAPAPSQEHPPMG